jgi:Protein of unknown function (DUF4245)
VSTQPQPAPKQAKSRLLQDGRDMFWSMAPLVLACIALAGLVGMCTFSPLGVRTGKVPEYDSVAALEADAQTLGFPIRLPKLPEGWQANSGARYGIEDARTDPATGQRVRAKVSRVGYLAPSGMYVSLIQSNADEDKLVRSIHADTYPRESRAVDGVTWIVYDSSPEGEGAGEPVWTTRVDGAGGGTQLAITGAGSVDEFQTLAAATQTRSPLPATRPTR